VPINGHFEYINHKAKVNRHFNAADSRQLLDLIDEIYNAQKLLDTVGMKLTICDDYKRLLDACERFLLRSGGSSIPDDFSKIDIIRYKAVFAFPET